MPDLSDCPDLDQITAECPEGIQVDWIDGVNATINIMKQCIGDLTDRVRELELNGGGGTGATYPLDCVSIAQAATSVIDLTAEQTECRSTVTYNFSASSSDSGDSSAGTQIIASGDVSLFCDGVLLQTTPYSASQAFNNNNVPVSLQASVIFPDIDCQGNITVEVDGQNIQGTNQTLNVSENVCRFANCTVG